MERAKHEYNGYQVSQRKLDGYFNLTEMAKAEGKRVQNWHRLKSTKELLKTFAQPPNTHIRAFGFSGLSGTLAFEVERFANGNAITWAHPDIAIQFAQWCSPEFALRVSRWVRGLLTTGKVELEPQPEESKLPARDFEAAEHLLGLLKSNVQQDGRAVLLTALADSLNVKVPVEV